MYIYIYIYVQIIIYVYIHAIRKTSGYTPPDTDPNPHRPGERELGPVAVPTAQRHGRAQGGLPLLYEELRLFSQ